MTMENHDKYNFLAARRSVSPPARFLFRKNPGERDENPQNHDRLKADRANDPFQYVSLYFGNVGFEFGPYFRNIGFEFGLKRRPIRLGGKIVMACFPQGFGERVGLLGRKMAFVPQCAGQAKGVEEKRGHACNMALD